MATRLSRQPHESAAGMHYCLLTMPDNMAADKISQHIEPVTSANFCRPIKSVRFSRREIVPPSSYSQHGFLILLHERLTAFHKLLRVFLR